MADVKIRKLDDWVVESFRARARQAGRSLEKELRQFLTEAARERRRRFADKLGIHRSTAVKIRRNARLHPAHPRRSRRIRMIVLDASVTVKWFASEPGSGEARSLVHSDEELVAPELTQVEVASTLVKKALRQQLNLEEAQEALSLWFEAINDGDIVLLHDADYLTAASELALQLAHPLADCLYLALAERLDVALITADRAFARRAARRSKRVQLLEAGG